MDNEMIGHVSYYLPTGRMLGRRMENMENMSTETERAVSAS
jgi:hypothetical protein